MSTTRRQARRYAPQIICCAVIATGCATRTADLEPTVASTLGVIVMAHGGTPEWDANIREAVRPIASDQPTVIAFGMADPATLQPAVDSLEQLGVDHIVVVRLFVSAASFREPTKYFFGLCPKPHHLHHPGPPLRIRATESLSDQGLADSPKSAAIVAERVRRLSRDPAKEAVLILAHGMGDEADNDHLLDRLAVTVDSVRKTGPFGAVRVMTLREDWQAKRIEAEGAIRQFVEDQRDRGHTVIVVPFRLFGFGPYAKVLEGLDYVSDGMGLIPHPLVTDVIRAEIARATHGRR